MTGSEAVLPAAFRAEPLMVVAGTFASDIQFACNFVHKGSEHAEKSVNLPTCYV